MLLSQVVLLLLLFEVHGDYGGGEKCSTHYETVYATVYDTVYEKKCSKGSNKKCKIIHSTSYKGGVETQCHPSYEPKCKTIYKTGYKKFCTTINDNKCYFINKSSYKTVYGKECKTSYKLRNIIQGQPPFTTACIFVDQSTATFAVLTLFVVIFVVCPCPNDN